MNDKFGGGEVDIRISFVPVGMISSYAYYFLCRIPFYTPLTFHLHLLTSLHTPVAYILPN